MKSLHPLDQEPKTQRPSDSALAANNTAFELHQKTIAEVEAGIDEAASAGEFHVKTFVKDRTAEAITHHFTERGFATRIYTGNHDGQKKIGVFWDYASEW